MNEVTTKVVEVITQLQNVVKDNAADAVNFGLGVIRINGFAWISLGILFAGLGIFVFWLCSDCKICKEHNASDEDKGFLYLMGFLFSLISACFLFYIWNWVAIFQPKLWLAHQILAKAVG